MKLSILSLALIALVFSSCSTAYKTGQTPDDVYFSPARPSQEYLVVDKEDDRSYRGSDYYEDRYIRNRIRNPYRYSALDDYYNNPYAYNSYGNYSSWNSPWNNYWTWNNYYNPYCGGGTIIIKNPANIRPPSRAVVFNTASYSNGSNRVPLNTQYYHPGGNPTYGSGGRYNNSNSSSQNNNSLGNSIRKVFSGSNSSSSNNNNSRSDNSSNSTPTRTYTPSSSSSSSSGSGKSSSSSSTGSSRPIR